MVTYRLNIKNNDKECSDEKHVSAEVQSGGGGGVTHARNSLALAAVGAALTVGASNRTNVVAETGWHVVVFDEPGAFRWTPDVDLTNARVLIVGGGGGGGSSKGGGGGGGQVAYGESQSFSAGVAYGGSVGTGGVGGTSWGVGGTGGTSEFLGLSATGGGGGAGTGSVKQGCAGANAGGSGAHAAAGAAQDPTGRDGEDATTGFVWYGNHLGGSGSAIGAGGGGGACGAGARSASTDGVSMSGDGGAGFPCDITGETVFYACGGGGGAADTSAQPGAGGCAPSSTAGAGSGANGVAGGAAVPGTGSGGGGGYLNNSSSGTGGAGGSGTVVISWQTPFAIVEGFSGILDGQSHGVSVTPTFTPDGTEIAYSTDGGVTWQTVSPTFSAAGIYRVLVRLTAPGYPAFQTDATVALDGEPTGARFVVPPSTAGHVAAFPYATWATAATNLQDAVDAAADAAGGAIYVQSGLYPVAETLALTNAGGLVVRSWKAGVGGLDPDGTVFDAGYPTRSNRVARLAGVRVEGLIFANGFLSGNGAGVYVEKVPGGDSSVILTDCVIRDCLAEKDGAQGGGIYLGVGGLSLAGCRFAGNAAVGKNAQGGALHCTAATLRDCQFATNRVEGSGVIGGAVRAVNQLVAEDCTFDGNVQAKTSGGEGGGSAVNGGGQSKHTFRRCMFLGQKTSDRAVLQLNNASEVSDCRFVGNSWGNGANGLSALWTRCVFSNETGAIAFNGSPTFRNCLFVSSAVPVDLWTGGSPAYENCTFVRTAFASFGQGWAGEGPRIVNCAFSGNERDWTVRGTPTVVLNATNCCSTAEGLAAFGVGNFVRRRLKFVNAAGGDYRLKPTSPCRDAGVTLDWMTADATDLDGAPRRRDASGAVSDEALPDIGCYECGQSRYFGSLLIIR